VVGRPATAWRKASPDGPADVVLLDIGCQAVGIEAAGDQEAVPTTKIVMLPSPTRGDLYEASRAGCRYLLKDSSIEESPGGPGRGAGSP